MSQEQAFLGAICADPDDVAVRLIYADWLDERGGKGDSDRSAFVRYQVDADAHPQQYECRFPAKLPGGAVGRCSSCPPCAAWLRATKTFHPIARSCLPAILSAAAPPGLPRIIGDVTCPDGRYFHGGWTDGTLERGNTILCNLRRGFVEEIACNCDLWLTHGPAIVRRSPVRSVTLTDRAPLRFTGTSAIFCWHSDELGRRFPEQAHRTSQLPHAIWSLIPRRNGDSPGELYFDSEPAAQKAASDACLTYARAAVPVAAAPGYLGACVGEACFVPLSGGGMARFAWDGSQWVLTDPGVPAAVSP